MWNSEATSRFELETKDLQSPALPLGHVAKILSQNEKEFHR